MIKKYIVTLITMLTLIAPSVSYADHYSRESIINNNLDNSRWATGDITSRGIIYAGNGKTIQELKLKIQVTSYFELIGVPSGSDIAEFRMTITAIFTDGQRAVITFNTTGNDLVHFVNGGHISSVTYQSTITPTYGGGSISGAIQASTPRVLSMLYDSSTAFTQILFNKQ